MSSREWGILRYKLDNHIFSLWHSILMLCWNHYNSSCQRQSVTSHLQIEWTNDPRGLRRAHKSFQNGTLFAIYSSETTFVQSLMGHYNGKGGTAPFCPCGVLLRLTRRYSGRAEEPCHPQVGEMYCTARPWPHSHTILAEPRRKHLASRTSAKNILNVGL